MVRSNEAVRPSSIVWSNAEAIAQRVPIIICCSDGGVVPIEGGLSETLGTAFVRSQPQSKNHPFRVEVLHVHRSAQLFSSLFLFSRRFLRSTRF